MKRTKDQVGGREAEGKDAGRRSMLTERSATYCDLRTHRCDLQFKDMGQRGFLIMKLPEEVFQGELGSLAVNESSQCQK